MNKTMENQLKAAGVNVDDLMERLMGNMNLITRFFKRFPDDKSYELLADSISKGNTDEAFRAAHTLKGVCANLSMTKLFDVISKQVEYLRAGDIENGTRLMPEVTKEYESMIETIRNINWEQ